MALKFMLTFLVLLVLFFLLAMGYELLGRKNRKSLAIKLAALSGWGVFISLIFWIWS